MSKYQMRINTDAYVLQRCSKRNWEPGTMNDYMVTINGLTRTLKNLKEVMWQLELFGGNSFLMSEYSDDNKSEYGLSERYMKFLDKNLIKYHDRLCDLDRKQYLSGYGWMQGGFSAGMFLEVLKSKGYVKIPFEELYDIRQSYYKKVKGCYLEIWKDLTGTIKQVFKENGIDSEGGPMSRTMTDAVYNIGFINSNGNEDETQFDIHGTRTIKETLDELTELFKDFCKENGYKTNKVRYITYVGAII